MAALCAEIAHVCALEHGWLLSIASQALLLVGTSGKSVAVEELCPRYKPSHCYSPSIGTTLAVPEQICCFGFGRIDLYCSVYMQKCRCDKQGKRGAVEVNEYAGFQRSTTCISKHAVHEASSKVGKGCVSCYPHSYQVDCFVCACLYLWCCWMCFN
jgi:hypothetical protein